MLQPSTLISNPDLIEVTQGAVKTKYIFTLKDQTAHPRRPLPMMGAVLAISEPFIVVRGDFHETYLIDLRTHDIWLPNGPAFLQALKNNDD